MTAVTAVAAGRRAAEALMLSTCRVTRFTPATLDTTSLRIIDSDPSDDLIYDGRCRIKSTAARVFAQDVEGQVLAAEQVLLYLPVTDPAAAAITVDDRVDITDGGPDPALTGRVFRVRGLFSQTLATAARYPLELLT